MEKVQRSPQPVKARAVIWPGAWTGAWAGVEHNILHHGEFSHQLRVSTQLSIMTASNTRCSLWRQFLAETLGKQTLSTTSWWLVAGPLSETCNAGTFVLVIFGIGATAQSVLSNKDKGDELSVHTG